MSKKALILTLVLLVVAGGGWLGWRVQDTRARAARTESEILGGLTADEINLILKSQAMSDASGVAGIAERTETRQAFLKGMREYLALAAEARREGLADNPDFKINLEYKQHLLLADLYKAKLSKEQGKHYVVAKEEMDAVWSNPENEKQFGKDLATLRAIQMAVARERGDQQTFPKLQGESLNRARDNWARTKLLSDRAKRDAEFMSRPDVRLRFKILEAGILSADYLRKHWAKSIKATEQDVAAYLAAHPEYDPNRKREKALEILRRAQAGEDFGKLAAGFSEDRSTKDKGGLYENVKRGTLWEEIENAALSLEPGEVANRLVETHTGYHIVKLENKTIKKAKDGGETITYNVRHILLQNNFEEPGNNNPDIPPPFLKAEEIAKAEVEKEKRNKFVGEVIQRNPITLPEDFTVELPESATATKPSPHQKPDANATP